MQIWGERQSCGVVLDGAPGKWAQLGGALADAPVRKEGLGSGSETGPDTSQWSFGAGWPFGVAPGGDGGALGSVVGWAPAGVWQAGS